MCPANGPCGAHRSCRDGDLMTTQADPFTLFNQWFAEAREAEINDPEAMAVATADAEGRLKPFTADQLRDARRAQRREPHRDDIEPVVKIGAQAACQHFGHLCIQLGRLHEAIGALGHGNRPFRVLAQREA